MTKLNYIREYSDLHLDRYVRNDKLGVDIWTPKELPTDNETALILAGDIWEGDRFIDHAEKSWIKPLADRFHSIIIVLGNHDLWGENLTRVYKKIQNRLFDEGLFNVHLLQDSSITIDGTKFIGATLWTDFNKCDPFTLWQAKQYMNDYRYIRVGPEYRKLLSDDIYKSHVHSRNYIFDNAKKDETCDKIVVVTHHSPSFQSLADQYKGDGFANGYYHSELGDQIVDSEIDWFFFGHTHSPMKYNIGNTVLINNAVGYFPFECTNYDEDNLIEIRPKIIQSSD